MPPKFSFVDLAIRRRISSTSRKLPAIAFHNKTNGISIAAGLAEANSQAWRKPLSTIISVIKERMLLKFPGSYVLLMTQFRMKTWAVRIAGKEILEGCLLVSATKLRRYGCRRVRMDSGFDI